jgi:hypothetical protein
MGNSLISSEYRDSMKKVLVEIFTNNYSYLDIEDRMSNTRYIDFIKPEEMNDSIVKKGYDIYGRQFIVFKCETKINDRYIPFFTTFFQRYNDISTVYHTAGKYGSILFHTEGSSTLEQMKYLRDLLQNGKIVVNYSDLLEMKISYRNFEEISENEKNEIRDVITLGWTT